MKRKQVSDKKEVTDYEVRCVAMKLATQHSRNCHYKTLVKLAEAIRRFLKNEKQEE